MSDAKNAVRELARKSANKKCFDCGVSGPQNYVCLTFGTFVCTSCGGALRSFEFKVKSISMTSFTEAEVAIMVAGGNKKARRKWLATYDLTDPHPDDIEQIKRKMKLVYIQRKFLKDDAPLKRAKKSVRPTQVSSVQVSESRNANYNNGKSDKMDENVSMETKLKKKKSARVNNTKTNEENGTQTMIDLNEMFCAVSNNDVPVGQVSTLDMFGAPIIKQEPMIMRNALDCDNTLIRHSVDDDNSISFASNEQSFMNFANNSSDITNKQALNSPSFDSRDHFAHLKDGADKVDQLPGGESFMPTNQQGFDRVPNGHNTPIGILQGAIDVIERQYSIPRQNMPMLFMKALNEMPNSSFAQGNIAAAPLDVASPANDISNVYRSYDIKSGSSMPTDSSKTGMSDDYRPHEQANSPSSLKTSNPFFDEEEDVDNPFAMSTSKVSTQNMDVTAYNNPSGQLTTDFIQHSQRPDNAHLFSELNIL